VSLKTSLYWFNILESLFAYSDNIFTITVLAQRQNGCSLCGTSYIIDQTMIILCGRDRDDSNSRQAMLPTMALADGPRAGARLYLARTCRYGPHARRATAAAIGQRGQQWAGSLRDGWKL